MDTTEIKKLATENNAEHLVETYVIAEEDVEKAASYVPTVMKMAFVTYVRDRCMDTLDISVSGNGDESSPLPSRYKVNTDKRSRYLMSALVGMYFCKDFERENEDDAWLMSVREYDMYAGGHIFEVLNRMKRNTNIRNKLFNILSDYSELKYRLDSEIKGMLDALNDSASRLLAYIESASSPESMREALDSVSKSQKLLDDFMAEREQGIETIVPEVEVDNGAEDEEL